MKMAHTRVTVEEVVKCSQIPKLFWIEGDIAKSKKYIWVWSVINNLAGFSEAWRSGVRHVHKHLIVGTKYKDFVPYINSHQKQYLIEDEVNNWVEKNALTICPQPAIFIDHHRTDKMSQKGIAKVIDIETIPGPSSIKHTYVQPPSNGHQFWTMLWPLGGKFTTWEPFPPRINLFSQKQTPVSCMLFPFLPSEPQEIFWIMGL